MRSKLVWRLALGLILLTLLASTQPGVTADQPGRFTRPDRIRYDGQCLTIDGQDTFIFSGAFHYFRCPKPLWPERFRKIKEAGFNTVETYVPWNYHERQAPAGPDDFSKVDLADVKDWMKMAHERFGLYTIIRPGPYICAEWDGGGSPRWLLSKQPADFRGKIWLRSDDPTYLQWSNHWMKTVCPVVAAEQITRKPRGKPGVILFQIENEYDLYAREALSEETRTKHLRSLFEAAKSGGIEVPIFTCWTRQCRNGKDPLLSLAFDAPNLYSGFNMTAAIDRLLLVHREQPNAPVMVPELQGGWFAAVGGRLSEDQGHDAAQINQLTLSCIQSDATILNYYMLFGGTNLGLWGSRLQTSTYDYNAPIREPGGVGDRYQAVKAIGLMLRKYGQRLARSRLVEATAETWNPKVVVAARQGMAGELFIFVSNRSRDDAAKGLATVKLPDREILRFAYDLGRFGAKIYYVAPGHSTGIWLPEPASLPSRAHAPAPVRIRNAFHRTDVLTARWAPVSAGEPLVSKGVFDSRYVLYRSRLELSSEQVKKIDRLELGLFTADEVVTSVNGRLLLPTPASIGLEDKVIELGDALREGSNEILVLYESWGQPAFGEKIGQRSGIRSSVLTSSREAGLLRLETWRVKRLDPKQGDPEVGPAVDDSAWATLALNDKTVEAIIAAAQPGAPAPADPGVQALFGRIGAAVYRTRLEVTPDMLSKGSTRLVFNRIDDSGAVYLNGRLIGESRDPNNPFVIDVGNLLRAGANTIAVVVRNETPEEGGLTRTVRLEEARASGLPLSWELATTFGGFQQQWWRPMEKLGEWSSVSLDTKRPLERKGSSAPSAKPEALLSWHAMEFELPRTKPHAWVPWRALIDASGCGLVYLNGELIGRYWQNGPQREYYLPECWLRFGPHQKNTLTLALRPTADGAAVRAVEIAPYEQYAERR